MSGLAWLLPGLVLWVAVLLVPWRPWSTRERLEPAAPGVTADLSRVCVLIPARNEAPRLGACLDALAAQGPGPAVVVVDDQSDDGTGEVAARAGARVVRGAPVPDGWSGKVWALEQGRQHLDRPLVLLLDADIALAPGMLAALLRRLDDRGAALVSVMAALPMERWFEKLLLPAFVFFFKLLYPFALSNRPGTPVAAAAGGCVLARTAVLEEIGGFGALKGALIDDCTLARLVKSGGHGTWMGLSRGARGLRGHRRPRDVWRMVARTAYTQLRCSPVLLAACTALMILAFVAPVAGLIAGTGASRVVAGLAWLAMIAAYLPVLRYYGRSPLWAPALPAVGFAFLLMTWDSALGEWRGVRSRWRGREYRGRRAGTGIAARGESP